MSGKVGGRKDKSCFPWRQDSIILHVVLNKTSCLVLVLIISPTIMWAKELFLISWIILMTDFVEWLLESWEPMRVDFLSKTVSIISEKEHSLRTGREGAILQQTLCISLLYERFNSSSHSQSRETIARDGSFLSLARNWLITSTWLTLWPLARKRRLSCWFYRMWSGLDLSHPSFGTSTWVIFVRGLGSIPLSFVSLWIFCFSHLGGVKRRDHAGS